MEVLEIRDISTVLMAEDTFVVFVISSHWIHFIPTPSATSGATVPVVYWWRWC